MLSQYLKDKKRGQREQRKGGTNRKQKVNIKFKSNQINKWAKKKKSRSSFIAVYKISTLNIKI